MRINKIMFLTVAFLALASSCVKEEIQDDMTQTQSPEKAILKSLLEGRDTKWTAEDLDIPTLNGEWYEITTANELAYLLEFGSTKGEKYRLTADIDVSVSSVSDKFPGEIGAESFETLANRLRELAFLNKGVNLDLTDRRERDENGEFLHEHF